MSLSVFIENKGKIVNLFLSLFFKLQTIGKNTLLFTLLSFFAQYKGKITHDVPISNMENALRIISDEMRGFFVTRQMYQMPLITTISLTGYPKLREIFGDYFRKNNHQRKT